MEFQLFLPLLCIVLLLFVISLKLSDIRRMLQWLMAYEHAIFPSQGGGSKRVAKMAAKTAVAASKKTGRPVDERVRKIAEES